MAQTWSSENCPIGIGFSHFSKCFLKYSSTELQPIMLWICCQSTISNCRVSAVECSVVHTHIEHSYHISCAKHWVQLKYALNTKQKCKCFFLPYCSDSSPSDDSDFVLLSTNQRNSAQTRVRAPSTGLSLLWACKLPSAMGWQTMITRLKAWHSTCWQCCLNLAQWLSE